ncbi:MAG: hypothetical protein LM575_03820 [Caldimicrobium sp.]|nr:hypothetical protein [Caldimicrobium sp.]
MRLGTITKRCRLEVNGELKIIDTVSGLYKKQKKQIEGANDCLPFLKDRQMLFASTFYPKIGYATERNTLFELEEMDSVEDGEA